MPGNCGMSPDISLSQCPNKRSVSHDLLTHTTEPAKQTKEAKRPIIP